MCMCMCIFFVYTYVYVHVHVHVYITGVVTGRLERSSRQVPKLIALRGATMTTGARRPRRGLPVRARS